MLGTDTRMKIVTFKFKIQGNFISPQRVVHVAMKPTADIDIHGKYNC